MNFCRREKEGQEVREEEAVASVVPLWLWQGEQWSARHGTAH